MRKGHGSDPHHLRHQNGQLDAGIRPIALGAGAVFIDFGGMPASTCYSENFQSSPRIFKHGSNLNRKAAEFGTPSLKPVRNELLQRCATSRKSRAQRCDGHYSKISRHEGQQSRTIIFKAGVNTIALICHGYLRDRLQPSPVWEKCLTLRYPPPELFRCMQEDCSNSCI